MTATPASAPTRAGALGSGESRAVAPVTARDPVGHIAVGTRAKTAMPTALLNAWTTTPGQTDPLRR